MKHKAQLKHPKVQHKPNTWRRLWIGLELAVGLIFALSLLKRLRSAPRQTKAGEEVAAASA